MSISPPISTTLWPPEIVRPPRTASGVAGIWTRESRCGSSTSEWLVLVTCTTVGDVRTGGAHASGPGIGASAAVAPDWPVGAAAGWGAGGGGRGADGAGPPAEAARATVTRAV